VFAESFGFPGFHCRKMGDAWIDCMTYLDDPSGERKLSRITVV